MNIKTDKLIILNEKGLKRYCRRKDEIGDIFQASWINEENQTVFVQPLNLEGKGNYLFESKYYRIAVDSEIKKYKMKTLFQKKKQR
jgi:hypothetical protein